ncbi:MAG: phospholipase C, phosphocholine-specific [Bacteroidota bacterium]
MDSRRDFLKKAALLSGGAAMMNVLPPAIEKALAINPALGSSYLDAEHIVILMQENRSFDHCFGSLSGVRGFNDPRAIRLPNKNSAFLQTDAAGNTYAPFRLDINNTKITWMGSLPHSRASQVDANNLGKYDKWLSAKKSGTKIYKDMPLTLGYYNREDLPFHYGMADAFTVCDQSFCSAMTSTTPNRSFFWTGKITYEENGLPKANIRNDDFAFGKLPWKTFPELLEENKIAWKFYQNEVDCTGGLAGEERAWLSNFGCNLLEFFKVYNVKFSEYYVKNLQKQVENLPDQINKLQEATPADEAAATKAKASIQAKQTALDNARAELTKWNKESFEKLTDHEKNLYNRAFVTNKADEHYRSITDLVYNDNGVERKVTVPKGDVLHQFRADVNSGKLPTVSWLASPQNFSDHPSAPWYGAWYVSEVLDILTKNPEVWKKTIFISTYDENDGYFDHVAPFSIPDNKLPGTGKVSAGIETEIEHVRLETELKQGIPKGQARGGAVGLGFRVPTVIASPWSRGGKVCSEVFDHTSTLQFLEGFVNKKFNKQIKIDNISEWRRTICGDLTSVFTPYNGDQLEPIPFLNRDKKVEDIYNAKFKQAPGNFKSVQGDDIAKLTETPLLLGAQEKGIRPSCALPYELYSTGRLSTDKKHFEIALTAANKVFGKNASGAPFTVYSPVKYSDDTSKDEISRNWYFGAKPGDTLTYNWPVNAFEDNQYHLRVHGPNGYYREFIGDAKNPNIHVACNYEKSRISAAKPTGNILVNIVNTESKPVTVIIKDNSYKTDSISKLIAPNSTADIKLDLSKNHNWYDFSVKLKGYDSFEQRYAGRVETGSLGKTDPLMGGLV